jgi:hypothetical protein
MAPLELPATTSASTLLLFIIESLILSFSIITKIKLAKMTDKTLAKMMPMVIFQRKVMILLRNILSSVNNVLSFQ